ncbi:MAG: pyrimidine reductase family protein [Actinobacteria bacterium]|nr:pyrimidine reductase family protein [Actinomycetota bacterium]
MRALVPSTGDDPDIHEWYAQNWVEHGGLRADFVSSVDGAVAVAGVSRGLQTPGDNRVFAALRDLADVVLVGSGTATAERYRPVRLPAERVQRRRDRGISATFTTAVLSGSLRLDPEAELYAGSAADTPTIVYTTRQGDRSIRSVLSRTCEVVDVGEHTVALAEVLRDLSRRGLTRQLCEGGPTLFAQLVAADLVDELCLSISPLLAGPGAGRITTGPLWAAARRLRLVGLLEEDGALFARYARVIRTRPGPARCRPI